MPLTPGGAVNSRMCRLLVSAAEQSACRNWSITGCGLLPGQLGTQYPTSSTALVRRLRALRFGR